MGKTIVAAGKRKRSIARATLKEGKGVIRINSILLDNLEPPLAQAKIKEPLQLAGDIANQVNITAKVVGGGVMSRAEAVRLAIGRALVEYSPKLKPIFNEYDRHILVADTRRKETRKPNDSKARAKRQKSYR